MVQKNSLHEERRSAERHLVSLPVETDRGPGTTRDVSLSGLYMVSRQALAVGDHLELTMNIPDPDQPGSLLPLRLVVRGTVVRVENVDGAAGAGIALDERSGYLARAS